MAQCTFEKVTTPTTLNLDREAVRSKFRIAGILDKREV
jgi:hypothetical protein